MTTNFQFAQAPNRKGNISSRPVDGNSGVTAITGPKHGTATPKGNQGAPAYTRQTENQNVGATAGRKQKVMVSTPKCYDKTPVNNAYMSKSVKNYGG